MARFKGLIRKLGDSWVCPRVFWAAGIVLALAIGAGLVLRSAWFSQQVRQYLVAAVQTATGGRVEIGSFQFDWKRMRAEARSFTVHGAEPAGKPALFHAESVAVGLKIVSLFRRAVDIQSLDVDSPRIYLIVFPDGHTNLPEPPALRNRSSVETILNLAIGRFQLTHGTFEVESRGRTPFDARGRNLGATFRYDRTGRDYRGDLSIQPLEVRWPGLEPASIDVAMAVTVEQNRIGIASAKLTNGNSQVSFSGALEDLRSPHATFQYNGRIAAADAERILRLRLLDRGTLDLAGSATWQGWTDYSLSGTLHARDLDYRGAYVQLRDFRVDGSLSVQPGRIGLSTVRLSGAWLRSATRIPLEGRAESIALENRALGLRGIALSALGGTFHGDARLDNLEAFRVGGEIAGVDARRAVALYSPEPLPWDALVSGTLHAEGRIRRKGELRASATLNIAPAPEGAPVHGQVAVSYDARAGVLDLGRSTIALPSSRVDFSGAIGRQLRVHAETRDLADLLPALGVTGSALPLKLRNGPAIFDGTVTGSLAAPQIAGRLRIAAFSYAGQNFNSLDAAGAASADTARVATASLSRGALRAQFQGTAGLRDWRIEPASPIAGNGSIRNAPLAGIAGLLSLPDAAVTGLLAATVQVSGAFGSPLLSGALEATGGSLLGEPFERFTAQVKANDRQVEVTSGELTAGAKQVAMSALFGHTPGVFREGRLRFQVNSNAMPLDQVRTLAATHPGVQGTVLVAVTADADVSSNGVHGIHINSLVADVFARGLQMTGQPLGDANLTARSQGPILHASFDSTVAGSPVRGEGQWRLDGDYPGSATVTFSKLDFARLRAWLAPSGPALPDLLQGSAEGELHIEGPALNPQMAKAEFRIPKLDVTPPSAPPLHNSGPIVATLANGVITVESARLVGRATDLGVSGRVLLQEKNQLDLRLNGRMDLAVVEEFDPNLTASGAISIDATVRGAFDAPQVLGQIEFRNAAFRLVDFPNGISNANGVIQFTRERATIQSFAGETGGGHVELSGFAGYGSGQPIFRLHARATEVRVRYPEGVSTVANANLSLTGTADRSMLAGTITILRTGFNPQSDFSSILAQSAGPVRTPSARAGLVGGLNFDIQIDTAPDLQFESALAQDLQLEANLRLRGTFSNPALLGRVRITHGQMVFFGTRFTINQGTVAFYNPVRVDPILDVDLETKARGIEVTLNVAGPLNKLNLTPRSDPPLQFQEIVALLATGRTPTSDPTLLAQQSTSPQSWEQMGASALLGQAIANPAAGRLQRFFGVSRIRIDPTLPGVEYNPQARITLEQQVTPEITFTYITNVTTTNPQVISVEWDFARQWSAVAVREENGLFGLDFFFKKRF